jgi:hypothetical protein
VSATYSERQPGVSAKLARISHVRLAPVAVAVFVSRVIIWVAGVAGAQWGGRVAGWRTIDPTGITQSYGHLGNLLLAPALRWDALGYLSIATHGYAHSTTVFYPGYPLTMAGLGWVIGSDVVAGLLVSIVAFGVGLWLLHRLTELELGRPAADGVVLLLAFAPLSLFFTALYTESLFFALSVGAIYAARRERWALAGLLVAAATVTRVTGIILLAPIALWQLQRYRRPSRQMAWLLPAPAALAGFMVYMHALGYGWLAPYRNEQSVRHFGGPWTTLFDAIKAFGHGVSATLGGTRPIAPSIAGPFSGAFESIVLLVVLGIAVAALVATFRRLPLAYGVYALLALLVAVSTNTGFQPLYSVDRYILTLFPLWMAAAAWLSERRLLKPAVLIGAALLAFYSFEFATWAFIA